jgi:hypothetical protein
MFPSCFRKRVGAPTLMGLVARLASPRTTRAGTDSLRDSPLEGSGFELPVPRCALVAYSAALVAPPDSAVSGSSLNGRLTTPIGGGPETASADPPRGSIGPTRMRPRKLGNRAAAGGQLIGSASSNVRLQTKLVAAAHQTGRLWPSRTRGSGECRVKYLVDGATAWLILLTS